MMNVSTTIHAPSKSRCQQAEPGEGYRLLEAYEKIKHGDEVWEPGWRIDSKEVGGVLFPFWRPRRRALTSTQELYNELLFAVARKWEGETRHQTALRYIREAEACITVTNATIESGSTTRRGRGPNR